MKKTFLSLLLALSLLAVAARPALAFQEFGAVYDATGEMETAVLQEYGLTTMPELTQNYGLDVRVDIVTDTEGYSVDEYAALFFDGYEYGVGCENGGVLLMLWLSDDGSGYWLGGWSLYSDYDAAFRQYVDDGLASLLQLQADAWDGALEEDQQICNQILATYTSLITSYFVDVLQYAPPVVSGPGATVAATNYVTDDAGLLSQSERDTLEQQAAAISERYGCGVYIVTVPDFAASGATDVYDFATALYQANDLGLGAERNGVLLLLSMADRDFTLIAHGSTGNAAFTDYGKDCLEDEFLDDFRDDDWYGGFSDYVSGCEEYLAANASGYPIDIGSQGYSAEPSGATDGGSARPGAGGVLVTVFFPALISLIACLSMKKKMKSVRKGVGASRYVADNGVAITDRQDRFTHTTVTRVRKQSSSSSSSHGGGTHVGGGGFSGRSGKF